MRRWPPLGGAFVLALVVAGRADAATWAVVDPADPRGRQNLLFLMGGFRLTLELSALAVALGVILGLAGALLLRSRIGPVRMVTRAIVELVGIVPCFVLLFWVYCALPILIG